ncbi:MAG: hypothetical protein V2A71_08565 [Candidatus Eisenbacteria bacterium]
MICGSTTSRAFTPPLGSPFETRKTLLETVKFVATLKPEIATPFIFYPFPATHAYEIARSFGFLTDRHFLNNDDGVMIDQPGITEADVMFIHRYYKRLVRSYQAAQNLPPALRNAVVARLDALLLSDLLPRQALIVLKRFLRKVRWETQIRRGRRAPARF